MKKLITSIYVLCFCAVANAQVSVNQVIILNEGYNNWQTGQQVVPVSIGSYNPTLNQYNQFALMPNATFASDVMIDGNYIYAACSDGIHKYEKTTKVDVGFVAVSGVRKMAVWNNQLLVTRGDVGLTNNYFQVYDKSSLAFIYQLDNLTGPQFTGEGIVVDGDSAFIALNNAFNFPNYTGVIGVVYLPTQTYSREFSLGALGINPDYMTNDNGVIYTLNNRDYTNASVSVYDVNNANQTTTDLSISTGCSASQLAGSTLLYQVSGQTDLMRFDVNSLSTTGSLGIGNSIYGMAHDEANDLIYAGNTDYSTYGTVYIYDMNGSVVNSFPVSVSPGSIAIDYTNPTGLNENASSKNISVYPNPASDFLFVKNLSNAKSIKVFDALGNIVLSLNEMSGFKSIDVRSLIAGVYTVQIEKANSIETLKFVKK